MGIYPGNGGQVREHAPATLLLLSFVLDGFSQQSIDGDKYYVGQNELLFSLPHQIQEFLATAHGSDYYKLGFDEECLSRLPGQYPFLLNPLNNLKITFLVQAAARLAAAAIVTGLIALSYGAKGYLLNQFLNPGEYPPDRRLRQNTPGAIALCWKWRPH